MELEIIKGVGKKTVSLLNNLNIYNVNDLVEDYPFRYDIIRFGTLNDTINEYGYIECEIVTYPKSVMIRRNFSKLSFDASIGDDFIHVNIFNRPFLKQTLKLNDTVVLYGKYDKLKNTFLASNIFFDKKNNTIEPIYHLTEGVTENLMRKLISSALSMPIEVIDYIPDSINKKYKLIDKKEALNKIHKPQTINDVKQAKLKLIYEEFFKFMFKVNYLKIKEKKANGIQRKLDEKTSSKYFDLLPFTMTEDQLKACKEIYDDMSSETRMNRLVLGDVGSGKTVVAAYAIYLNYLSKHQTAFMAPTEILAIQHYKSLTKLFKGTKMNIELLTGHMTKKEKNNIYDRLKNHDIDLVIGTHALISEEVTFDNLGLVITDEQHRFGVLQRNNLENKGTRPDVLYLSATPIPRTYALTIYGDTDISIIKTKPKGRKEIITKVVKEKDIKYAYNIIQEELNNDHQVFVVSPLIDNPESELTSVNELKGVLDKEFPNYTIGIIHGKLKQEEKDIIMNEFLNNKIQILISTTVIEVGIDIPNSTIMMIYNAERFGLATLHQLRGRVGRNDLQSYCLLVSNKDNQRLKVMEESNDGFYITEKDFEMRREGDLFGTVQSGDMVFKIGDIRENIKILMQCKIDSEEFITSNEYKEYDIYQQIINEISFLN
jgi:ATP-dependent DNA helicase RecG